MSHPRVKCTDDKYKMYMYPIIICSVLLPFGIVLIYFVELVSNRKVLAPTGLSPECLSADELQAVPRRLIGLDTSTKSTEKHPKPQESASGGLLKLKFPKLRLRESFRAVLRNESKNGVTRAELVAEYKRRITVSGEVSAVEWLQIVVRKARGEAKHLEFLFGSYRPAFYWFEALVSTSQPHMSHHMHFDPNPFRICCGSSCSLASHF